MRLVEASTSGAEQGIVNSRIVGNKSYEHPATLLGQGGCLRFDLVLCFFC